MRETPPLIQDEVLTYQQDGSPVQVTVGSAHWYAWLQTASTFTFQSGQGHFTARKERAGNRRGELYWRAYQKRGGKLHRAYLGQSEELTLERLQSVAVVLAHKEEGEDLLNEPGLEGEPRPSAEASPKARTHRREVTGAQRPHEADRSHP